MPNADPLIPRPALVSAAVITHALGDLAAEAETKAEVWRLLTERYVVDLDALAMLLPPDRPEPVWLSPRN